MLHDLECIVLRPYRNTRLSRTPSKQGSWGDISAADIAETLLCAQKWCKEQVVDALPQGCDGYLERCWPNIRGPT